MHQSKACNFTGRKDSDWADELSTAIRAGFAKFHELLDSTSYHRCIAKASSDEKEAIDEILSFMKEASHNLGESAGSQLALVLRDSSPLRHRPELLSFSSLGNFFEDIGKRLVELDDHMTPRSGISRVGSSTSLASTALYSPRQPDCCGGLVLVVLFRNLATCHMRLTMACSSGLPEEIL